VSPRRWYRPCRYRDCTVRASDAYLARHERLPHIRCSCSWVGAQFNWASHRAQRIRFSLEDPEVERSRHAQMYRVSS
jgi:hypothetical protein